MSIVLQASAPGKVLILGGYLIVVAPNVGISIGVDARFTTRVLRAAASTAANTTVVHINSVQFKTEFEYTCVSESGEVHITQNKGPESPFLYNAVLFAVAAAQSRSNSVNHTVYLELLADNDFYSQRNYLESIGQPVNTQSLRALPKQLPLVGDVSKTGLGSSAAMTSSVVAALLAYFARCGSGESHTSALDTELVHRVAQVAHSVSQGKIGSGFDVYTAIYGTCAYRRFPAAKVEALMREENARPGLVSVKELADCVDMSQEWVQYVPFRLPQGIKLILGDVHQGGSSTPGMVAKIMAWRKTVAEQPDNLWDRLRDTNERYIEKLRALLAAHKADAVKYAAAVEKLQKVSNLPHLQTGDAVEQLFTEASRCALESRTYLRDMGVAAGVKVEPEELSGLLNDTAALPGVFAVGCPGAGGYDAVFALVVGDENCAAVERFWEDYKKMDVCPLLVREDPSGLVIEESN